MEKEFIPYELAVKLKALGFDEPCTYAWCITPEHRVQYEGKECLRTDGNPFGGFFAGKNWNISYVNNKNKIQSSAPTFSQAFRWFREKYQIFPEVVTDCTTEPKFIYTYNTFYGNPKDLTEQEWSWGNNIGQYSELYKTYEEAELACLEKLIEIVESKSE